ncbi:Holliday junction branch migration protein RuvA [Candidatus Sumerlaeota bacterium]|nr:Holliday junction branch migration protein RuvA [Candidatus Sumerlaeota bacterium]
MIEFLSGILWFEEPQHIIIDVGGVGYGLDVPASTYERLPEVGQSVALHCYLYLRENELQLFGFLTPEERAVFEIFINTSGIGPKTSLGILSSVPIGEFARAVTENDLAALMRIPGVGRKTAERLVVELRDKMKAFMLGIEARGAQLERRSPQQEDAIAALVNLGTRPAIAARAVSRAAEILGEDASSEDLVRQALKHR